MFSRQHQQPVTDWRTKRGYGVTESSLSGKGRRTKWILFQFRQRRLVFLEKRTGNGRSKSSHAGWTRRRRKKWEIRHPMVIWCTEYRCEAYSLLLFLTCFAFSSKRSYKKKLLASQENKTTKIYLINHQATLKQQWGKSLIIISTSSVYFYILYCMCFNYRKDSL